MQFKRASVLLAVPAILLAGTMTFVALQAHRTLTRATNTITHQRELPFELRLLTHLPNPGFEPVSSATHFTAAALFQNALYISSASGLFIYNPDGTLRRMLHLGTDLPPAPLGTLAVGLVRGTATRQLLIATAGEGALLLAEDGTLRQLRPSTAADRDLTAILALPTGDLLLGTRNAGLLVWNGRTIERFHPDFDNLHITALAADTTGFWVGTRDNGLFHWNAGTAEHFTPVQGLPDADIESLAVRNNTLFVGTPVGIQEFQNGHPTRLLGKGLFAHALLPEQNSLTIATLDEGLRTLALQPHTPPHDASNTSAVQSFLTVDSTTYAVLADRIQRRESTGEWRDVITPQLAALTDANISALAFDDDAHLWVGYFDRGLDILRPDRTQHVEDGHVFCVNRLALDPARRTIAAATANGLVLFDREGHPRQTLTRHDGLIADHVTDIVFRPNGLTLATPAGLTFLDAGQSPQSLYAFQGLVNNHVYALALQPDGLTLAGTLGGLSLLKQESVERNLTIANSGLKHNWITAITPDTQGGWNAGTYGAGVMHIDREGNVHALTPAFVVNPNAMLRTATHLFAGSLGGGLWAENLATSQWTNITAGLPSLNVTALAEHDGTLYVGTENGLVKIPERSVHQ